MDKRELRSKQKKRLIKFSMQMEKRQEDKKLMQHFAQLPALKDAHNIGITASMPLEVDTAKITAHLWDLGKNVFLAKVVPGPDRAMNFVKYTYQSKLKKSKFGIEEVADSSAEILNNLDLLLVPGLAFSVTNFQRLGFGGGYYDRFLAKHPKIKTVSLANTKMIFQSTNWPVERTDIAVQTLITPEGILTRR